MLEIIGLTATVIAVLGVILNNHRMRMCFILWLISNAMTAGLHIQADMIALTIRDLIFFGLAIHGLWLWGRREK